MNSGDERAGLPLEATPNVVAGTWSLRLPVRADEVTLAKQVVVRERVLVRRQQVEDRVRVDARLLHEELRTSTSGPVQISEHQRTNSQPT